MEVSHVLRRIAVSMSVGNVRERERESECSQPFPSGRKARLAERAKPFPQLSPMSLSQSLSPSPAHRQPVCNNHSNTTKPHPRHVSRRRHHPLRDGLRLGHARTRPRLRIRAVRHVTSAHDAAIAIHPLLLPHAYTLERTHVAYTLLPLRANERTVVLLLPPNPTVPPCPSNRTHHVTMRR